MKRVSRLCELLDGLLNYFFAQIVSYKDDRKKAFHLCECVYGFLNYSFW